MCTAGAGRNRRTTPGVGSACTGSLPDLECVDSGRKASPYDLTDPYGNGTGTVPVHHPPLFCRSFVKQQPADRH